MDCPRVSVVVRSYNRLPALCELVEALLAQRHDSFEIVVVEQSTEGPPEAFAALRALERDPRLVVLRHPPLGGARARNVGVQRTRGEIVVFIDDDDLPGTLDYLADMERPFREDPLCVGVTGHQFWGDGVSAEPGPLYRFYAWRRCMRLSPVTRLAYTYARYDRRCRADWVHGTGGAYRRSVFERFGGWDEDTIIEDEPSLAYRMARGLEPGEHIVFDPRARLQRRMAIGGGLAKRWMTPARFYARFLLYVHHVVARYHPVRVRLLYPLYVIAGYRWAVSWVWGDILSYRSMSRRALATVAFTATLPWHAVRALGEPFGTMPGSGISVRERLTPR